MLDIKTLTFNCEKTLKYNALPYTMNNLREIALKKYFNVCDTNVGSLLCLVQNVTAAPLCTPFLHLAFKNIFCTDLVSLPQVQPSSCPEC